jgi:hypothetical protein
MKAYYNENEAYAAQWLRNLIAAGLIMEGDVDERSIKEVQPNDGHSRNNQGSQEQAPSCEISMRVRFGANNSRDQGSQRSCDAVRIVREIVGGASGRGEAKTTGVGTSAAGSVVGVQGKCSSQGVARDPIVCGGVSATFPCVRLLRRSRRRHRPYRLIVGICDWQCSLMLRSLQLRQAWHVARRISCVGGARS